MAHSTSRTDPVDSIYETYFAYPHQLADDFEDAHEHWLIQDIWFQVCNYIALLYITILRYIFFTPKLGVTEDGSIHAFRVDNAGKQRCGLSEQPVYIAKARYVLLECWHQPTLLTVPSLVLMHARWMLFRHVVTLFVVTSITVAAVMVMALYTRIGAPITIREIALSPTHVLGFDIPGVSYFQTLMGMVVFSVIVMSLGTIIIVYIIFEKLYFLVKWIVKWATRPSPNRYQPH